MITFITLAALSAIIITLSICNMMGNISSLHWYHRQRVSEADRKPFGRLVGLGTMIIGVSILIFGAGFWIYEETKMDAIVVICTLLLLIGITAGLCISFYAMKKYNQGIF